MTKLKENSTTALKTFLKYLKMYVLNTPATALLLNSPYPYSPTE